MRRLYVQIYLAFLAVGLLTIAVTGCLAGALFDRPLQQPAEAVVLSTWAVAKLDPDDPGFARSFARVASRLGTDVALWDGRGRLLASSGEELPYGAEGRFHERGLTGVRIRLPDGKLLAAGSRPSNGRRVSFLALLSVTGLTVAIGCWPIARRITRRLELVQDSMSRWGAGDLAVRVPVRGRDEVAGVAHTFNEAADRVQALFDAHRRVLASASHELRSPLARLRMSLALLDDGDAGRAPLVRGAERDIDELDRTVGELLQVGRMQALPRPADPQPVDLLALLRDEGARVGAAIGGPQRTVSGDPHLLRRMVRNLLANAAQHGAPPIEAHTTETGLEVLDRGQGVAVAHRADIFRPFWRPPGHTEGRDGGVGLGLHLVREIARHHGGTVHVEGRQGGGSRFVVVLPT